MKMWTSKSRCLFLIYFLLSDMVQAQSLPSTHVLKNPDPVISTVSSFPFTSPNPLVSINQEKIQKEKEQPRDIQKLASVDYVPRLVSALAVSLHGHVHLHANLSCAELAAGPWNGPGFSQELLGLVMVPVLVSAGCVSEAQALVLNLYMMLGQDDTHELLEDIVTMIRHDSKASLHTSRSSSFPPRQSQLRAIMFNIQKLAEAGQHVSKYFSKNGSGLGAKCQGWLKVKGTQLLGEMADNVGQMSLSQAKQFCQNLGLECAGVTKEGETKPGVYRVILRPGSHILPSTSFGKSESWIHNCGSGLFRLPRQIVSQTSCKNEKEEQVYKVVEWIPAVSTLYNLGTAAYYASMRCSNTAKERAIHGAVDLGTDTLMALTGGTAGIVGYVMGAGIKTGVKAGLKYLINGMNQEGKDLIMNQNSWEEGTFTIH